MYNRENVWMGFQVTDYFAEGERERVHFIQNIKKETGRCPEGDPTGRPRLGDVWGKSWVQSTSYRASARMAQWS